MTTPKGYPIEGEVEDITKQFRLNSKHSTVIPKGYNRRGLDVVGGGFFEVSTDIVVENTDLSTIQVTGHSFIKGDLIRLNTTANPILTPELFVEEIIDANTVRLAGAWDQELTAGDTIDLYRYVSPKVAPDGSSLATVASAPVRFIKDGVWTEVEEDTAVPANNAPLPVKLTGVTGDINITAGDLNVALNHSGASADSTQVGDGTNIWLMNASGEGTVRDADAITELQAILDKMTGAPALETKQDAIIIAIGDLLNELQLKANLTDIQPVSLASSPLPTGAATEATLSSIDGKVSTEAKQDTLITAVAKETTLSAMSTKIDSLATEATLSALNTKAATETTLAALKTRADLLATELTLQAIRDRLPALLGPQAKAGSLSVTYANDLRGADGAFDTIVDHYSQISPTTGAWLEVVADTGSIEGRKLSVYWYTGVFLELAIGGSGSETRIAVIPKGGFAGEHLEVRIPANSRLSVRALGDDAPANTDFLMHIMG